jgi:hypothetical protein
VSLDSEAGKENGRNHKGVRPWDVITSLDSEMKVSDGWSVWFCFLQEVVKTNIINQANNLTCFFIFYLLRTSKRMTIHIGDSKWNVKRM